MLICGFAAAEAQDVPAKNVPAAGADDELVIKLPDLKKKLDAAKIKVSGYAQAQYFYNDSKNNSANANSGFAIRRAAISVKGEISDAWSAEVGFEIDSGNKGGKLGADNSTIFVDKAIIAYKNAAGKLTAGYQNRAS